MTIRRRNDVVGRRKSGQFFAKAICESRDQCSATSQENVATEAFAHLFLASTDAVVDEFVNTSRRKSQNRRFEDSLGAAEAFVTHGDDLRVRERVGRFDGRRRCRGSRQFGLEILSNVAQPFLDVSDEVSFDNLVLRGGAEVVATGIHELQHEIGEIVACQIEAANSSLNDASVEDGHYVRYAEARVQDESSAKTGCLQR